MQVHQYKSGADTPEPNLRPVTPIGIAALELRTLVRDMKGIITAPPDLIKRLEKLSQIVGGLDPYIEEVTSPPSTTLIQLADRTAREPWGNNFKTGENSLFLEAEMLSGHVEGQFLKMLVRALQARRVLEIGLFTGYSAVAMAEALPEKGKLIALELDASVAKFAKKSFIGDLAHKIDVYIGPAQDALEKMFGEQPFDFIFIDADKGSYAAYLDTILEQGLLSDTGLICVDNTLLQGEAYLDTEAGENGRAIAAFNQKVAKDPRVQQVLIPLRDGVTLISLAS